MKRFLAILSALSVFAAMLGLFCVRSEAASKKIDIYGNSISVNAEKLCFIAAEDAEDAELYGWLYTDEYRRYYPVPMDAEIDCAELVEKLPKLKRLAFIQIRLKNVEELAKLKDLTILEIYNDRNNTDLSFLKKLGGKLKMFCFSNMRCEDASPLKYLKNAERIEAGIRTEDFSALKGLTKLKKLSVSGNMKDADDFKKLKNLTSIKLDSWQLSDISALSGLKKLKSVEIYSQADDLDISPLEELPKLEALVLDRGVKSLDSLLGMKKLKKLSLYNMEYNPNITAGRIKNVVSQLTWLEELEILNCRIGSCDFLKELTRLKRVSFISCRIKDISGVGGLKDLERIIIWETYGDSFMGSGELDLAPLGKLTGLKHVTLYNTNVKSLKPLGKLKNLESLSLDGVGSDGIDAIMELKNLKKLYYYAFSDYEFLEKFREKHPDCEVIT